MSTPAYHLITSRDVGRGPSEEEGLANKYMSVPAGGVVRLCDIAGPGRIVRIWATLPVPPGSGVLRDLVLRMFWDDEPSPSVECPFGDFFGAGFGKPRPFTSRWLTIGGGGYVCAFEMPFASRAVVELYNPSRRDLHYVFYQIGYYREPRVPSPVRTFHAQWRLTTAEAGDPGVPVLSARGKGRLVGMKMDVQCRGWWLRPPLREIVFPRALGLGLLEGWETIQADDRPAAQGTGLEDYFNGGFYFRGGPFSTPTHGATVRSLVWGRVSAYRFHVDDPVHFDTSLEVTADHGFHNQMAGRYATIAYWYQEEPHLEHPPLAPPDARQPSVAWLQLAQLACLVAVPLLVVVAWLAWAS